MFNKGGCTTVRTPFYYSHLLLDLFFVPAVLRLFSTTVLAVSSLSAKSDDLSRCQHLFAKLPRSKRTDLLFIRDTFNVRID